MATRLYLPASGTAPLASLAFDANWELTTSATRYPCSTTKSNTTLADVARTWGSTSTQQWVFFQFQTTTMKTGYSWTSDTVSMVIRGLQAAAQTDSHLAYSIRVVSVDGGTVRGTIGLFHATSSEFGTSAATRIHDARGDGSGTFTSYAGDRIIVEIGLHGVSPTLTAVTLRIGDPSGTSDFALTAGLTTDLCPWVELSRTVTFGNATIAGVTGGVASVSGVGRIFGTAHIAGVIAGNTNLVSGVLHGHGSVSGQTDGVSLVSGTLTAGGSTEYISGKIGGAFFITDDFEAYTTGALGGQGNWIDTLRTLLIADTSGDNRVVGEGLNLECGARRSDTIADAQYAEVVIDVSSGTSGNGIGPAVRCSGAAASNNGCYFGYYGGQVFYVHSNGVWESIDDGGTFPSVGDVLRLEIEGTTLRCYRNSSLDTSMGGTGEYDVSTIISTVTALAHGGVGISAYSNTDRIDDFEGGELTGSTMSATVSGTLRGRGVLISYISGTEQITNGTFDNNTGWDDSSSDWEISTGKLRGTGTSNFDPIYPANHATITVNLTGKLTKYEFDVEYTSGEFRFRQVDPELSFSGFAGHFKLICIYATVYDDWFVTWPSFVGSIDNLTVRECIPQAVGVASVSGTLTEAAATEYIEGASDGVTVVSGVLQGKGTLQGATDGIGVVTGTLLAKGSLYGIADGIGTVTATLLAKGSLYGATDGIAVINGVINGRGGLSAVTDGQSVVSGTLLAKGTLQGVSDGVADVLGTLLAKGTLRGATDGIAEVSSATLYNATPTTASGESNGVSGVIGTLLAEGVLAGQTDGVASVTATIIGRTSITCVIDGTATASGTLLAKGSLYGNVETTSIVTGILFGRISFAGASDGSSTTLATLLAYGHLEGATDGSAIVAGTLSGSYQVSGVIEGTTIVSGTLISRYIIGVSDGVAIVTTTLTAKGRLYGTINGSATAEGLILSPGQLLGHTDGSVAVTGTLIGSGVLQGATEGSTILNGVLSGRVQLSGLTDGVGVVTATLTAKAYILGEITGQSVVTGNLSSRTGLFIIINGVATTTATLVGKGAISANINSISVVAGTLSVIRYIQGVSEGVSSCTGSLVGVGYMLQVINGATVVTATLLGTGTNEGHISGISSVTGILNATGTLIGLAEGRVSIVAYIVAEGAIVGIINGVTFVGGELGSRTELNGNIIGYASIEATLIGTGGLAAQSDGLSTIDGRLGSPGKIRARTDGIAQVYVSLSGRANTYGLSEGFAMVSGRCYYVSTSEIIQKNSVITRFIVAKSGIMIEVIESTAILDQFILTSKIK